MNIVTTKKLLSLKFGVFLGMNFELPQAFWFSYISLHISHHFCMRCSIRIANYFLVNAYFSDIWYVAEFCNKIIPIRPIFCLFCWPVRSAVSYKNISLHITVWKFLDFFYHLDFTWNQFLWIRNVRKLSFLNIFEETLQWIFALFQRL